MNCRELSQTYDQIASQYGVTNDGKRNSDIYELYSFVRDFEPGGPRKRLFNLQSQKKDAKEDDADGRRKTVLYPRSLKQYFYE